MADLGRGGEADAEIDKIDRTHVLPGPASLIAEHLEHEKRLEEALTWFNIACRNMPTDDGGLAEVTLFVRPELRGRRRVRQALGLQPDSLDWPPERNAPCWCASGRKYKKCCGSPAIR